MIERVKYKEKKEEWKSDILLLLQNRKKYNI